MRRHLTSLGRPLDPAWPTNRAVLIALPIGAFLGAALEVAVRHGSAIDALGEAGRAVAVVLCTWALAREIVPDDNPAAFIALALGFSAHLALPQASVILLVTAVMLSRMVNRSVGPPATTLDSVFVLALVTWAASVTLAPGLALTAAGAFACDAILPGGRRRSWGFAALCLLAGVAAGPLGPLVGPAVTPVAPRLATLAWTLPVAMVFGLAIFRLDEVESVADLTGEPLAVGRVRAGMAIALAVAVLSLVAGDAGVGEAVLVWAVLGGVSVRFITGRR